MAGSATQLVKKRLVDLSRLALVADPVTEQVTVAYSYSGKDHERELVHGGRATSTQSYPLSDGGTIRHQRDQTVTVKLHVVVRIPGGTQEEAEARATEIGTRIEERIAATADLDDTDSELGVIQAGVVADDLDGDVDDDSAIAVLTYDVEVDVRLT